MPDEAGSSPDADDVTTADAEGEEVFSSPDEALRAAGNVLLQTGDAQIPISEEAAGGTTEQDAEQAEDEYANALKKAGGDKARLGREFWEKHNQNSELARRNQELEDELESLRSGQRSSRTPEDVEPDPELASDLAWHNEQLGSVSAEIRGNETRMQELADRLIPAQRSLADRAFAQYEILPEDDSRRARLYSEHQNAVSRHDAFVREWKDLSASNSKSQRDARELERRKTQLERQLTRYQQTRLQSEREVAGFKAATRSEFGRSVEEAFSGSGLPDAERPRFERHLRAAVTHFLDGLDPDSPAVDMRALVMSEAEALTGLLNARGAGASRAASQQKARTNAALRGGQAPRQQQRVSGAQAGAGQGSQAARPELYVSPEEEARRAKAEARKLMGVR